MDMVAFYKTGDFLAKVYRPLDGRDWQVLTNNGHEYWYSVWTDCETDSMYRAIIQTCKRVGVEFEDEFLTIV